MSYVTFEVSPCMLYICDRLTYWLSNSIMLRAIVSQALREISLSAGPYAKSNDGERGSKGRSPSTSNELSPTGEEAVDSLEEFDDWQDPKTFIIALEKVEAWIFSRIIESVWWQVSKFFFCSFS